MVPTFASALARALAAVLAAVDTSTTEVRRVVGEPLPSGVVLGAGAALFVVIVVAGLAVRRRR